ncbi:YjzD family protein [Enterococcus sp. LJL128]|uniref:YjzD family protein n=1 Tax=Enterococcus sp. LJL51 TaxID=3416656 RepID=UPI003CEE8767
MRYIIALFWSFVLGQVVGYIGGALNNGSYDFMLTTIISLIAGVLILLIGHFAVPKKKTSQV